MMESIDELLHNGRLTCQDPTTMNIAANFATRASVKAIQELTKVLQNKEHAVDKMCLAVWFGECAFIYHTTGHTEDAIRCFYTDDTVSFSKYYEGLHKQVDKPCRVLSVFNGEWNPDEHSPQSKELWNALVYSKQRHDLRIRYSKLKQLLIKIEKVAKMAEQQAKLNLCIAITEDIQRIFCYLSNNLNGLEQKNITKSRLIRDGTHRLARCALQLKDHVGLRILCGIIQKDIAEFTDCEAYELTARSFQMTKEYHLGLKDAKEAIRIRYCQDAKNREGLQRLHDELQQQLQKVENPDSQNVNGDWLEGTAAAIGGKSGSHGNIAGKQQRKKKQHKRPKAKNPANDHEAMRRDGEEVKKSKQPVTLNDSSRINDTMAEGGDMKDAGVIVYQRGAAQSSSSTGNSIADSIFDCNMTSAASLSDSDFCDDISETDNEETLKEMDKELIDAFVASPDDDASFYQKSCNLHLPMDGQEYVEEMKTESRTERLLHQGLKLNERYLSRFVGHRRDVRLRKPFYDKKVHTKDELEEMLIDEPSRFKRCTLHIERPHMAYCTPIDSNDNVSTIEISGRSKAGQTFDEDEVVVDLLDTVHEERNKRYGKVVGILERRRHKDTKHPVFICTLDDIESHLVRPMCKTVPKIHILNQRVRSDYPKLKKYKLEVYDYDEQAEKLEFKKIIDITPTKREKLIVLVGYINWGEKHIYPRGAVVEVFPFGETVDSGLAILNLRNEVPRLYKKTTVTHVEAMCHQQESDEPNQFELTGRRDFTSIRTFTIDPEGCCDIDDALSLEHVEGGYRVGVHIADVSARVHKDDHVDIEARERATTFYSGIRKSRHMLPEPLSLELCSLKHNRVRLTLSVMLYMTKDGKIMRRVGDSFEIVKSYISSRRQFTYEEAKEILSSNAEDNDLAADIRTLAKLAKVIRHDRLGNAMFAVDTDEIDSTGEFDNKFDEAHYLVEEFMIRANCTIARVLTRAFPQCVPLRCQQPPSKESIEEFVKSHNVLIDTLMCLQDKNICDNKTPSLDSLLQHDKGDKVFVSKANWALISGEDLEASSRCIRTDNLHPLQHLIRQHWLQMQTEAFYKCVSSNPSMKDNHHYSLDLKCYTHFTSPIRRYIDVVVHRLVHAYIDKAACPYERKEIEDICIYASSRIERAKKYKKECCALQQALGFKQCQKTVVAYVDEISDRGLTLSSVSFRHVAKEFRELPFSLLNVCSKPVIEDPRSVSVRWNRRLYDIKPSSGPPDRGAILKMNPMQGTVAVRLVEWARLLKCAVLGNSEDLRRAIDNTHIIRSGFGRDDVSTECIDVWKIRPITKFSLKYEFGHAVRVQMSAEARQGILAPRPVLYNLSQNVKFCLNHMQDPVRYLYHYSTRATREKYQSIEDYINVWLHLVSMQAAIDAVHNESFVINNIPLSFSGPRTGKFALDVAYCKKRNLEFSGTISDEDKINTTPQSYDWLCIKQTVQADPSRKCLEKVTVYHAEVKNSIQVKKMEEVVVTFELHREHSRIHDNARANADQETLKKLASPAKDTTGKYSVEVIKKTETDRRTESILKQFSTLGSELAKCIAMNNKAFPKFNTGENHGILTARDIDDYFNTKLPDIRKLPRSNTKQEEAMNKAVASSLTLIQGPPGTGKTYTGIKLIFWFNQINQDSEKKSGEQKRTVLFCGPSNKSVDLVARLLLDRLRDECPKFVRIYGRSIEDIDFPVPGRTLTNRKTKELNVDAVLKPVALHHVIREAGKPFAEKLKYYNKLFKKKDGQVDSEEMFDDIGKYLSLVQKASIAEIKENDVILCTTAVGSNSKVLKGANVHQIIIDEAGMCTEPECLVPIIATNAEQVVLIGDHKQLRPIVTCSQSADLGLDKSLFERYASLISNDKCRGVEFTMLEVQYRMHPQICKFPSMTFYEGLLRTGRLPWDISDSSSDNCDRLLEIWPFDRDGVYPHVLVDVEGVEQVLTVSTDEGNEKSKSNSIEVGHVLNVYRYMIDHGIDSNQINVMSQYNAQCAEIRKALETEGYSNFVVTTVVSSQGGEWDYVIFSTVRSLPHYKIEHNPSLGWCKSNLGFITDKNQVNVALTRAKKGLVIIGNKRLLRCDAVWNELICHYEKHNCLKTPDTFPPPRKSRRQIMEENRKRSQIRYRDTANERGTATYYHGSVDVDDEPDPGASQPFNRYWRGQGRGRGQFNRRFQTRRHTLDENVVTDSDSDRSLK